MFTSYLEGALRNRVFVGATGSSTWMSDDRRFDGENYQIGMVDVCDTRIPKRSPLPYGGAELYGLRSK